MRVYSIELYDDDDDDDETPINFTTCPKGTFSSRPIVKIILPCCIIFKRRKNFRSLSLFVSSFLISSPSRAKEIEGTVKSCFLICLDFYMYMQKKTGKHKQGHDCDFGSQKFLNKYLIQS